MFPAIRQDAESVAHRVMTGKNALFMQEDDFLCRAPEKNTPPPLSREIVDESFFFSERK